MKRVLFFVILGLVAALPSLAMADANWTGTVSDDFNNPANWDNAMTNEWATSGLFVWGGTTPQPVMTAGLPNLGQLRIGTKDAGVSGPTVTQTGGDYVWVNGAGYGYALTVHGYWVGDPDAAKGVLNMTSGSQTTPSLGVGANPWGSTGEGTGEINISGDASLSIIPWWADGSSKLLMVAGRSLIDIRDDGTLSVPLSLQGTVDGYIAGGQIVAGAAGASLATAVVGDNYVVSCVPEPGTLLLLCLGLGSLALIRRK